MMKKSLFGTLNHRRRNMKTYTFICSDDDEQTTTTVEFFTDSDMWSGYDGPMWKFFDFLKGTGFVFGNDDHIGVERDGKFISASDPFPQFSYTSAIDENDWDEDDECDGNSTCCNCKDWD